MPIAPETVILSGRSGLVFQNTYDASVTAQYRSAIVAAENDLQSRLVNSVTLNLSFALQPLSSSVAAENEPTSTQLRNVSYATLTNALRAHAVTADDFAAIGALPLADPTQGQGFRVPVGMARALGLAGADKALDLTVTLNSTLPFTFGSDAIGALEHEITELALGRFGGLGIKNFSWYPMDLFRYTSSGVHDYSGGRDGQATFFSVDGTHILTRFHNSESTTGVFDGFDFADWDSTVGDAFGPGGPGSPGALSATDLRVMDVLGWTPAGSVALPSDDYANNLTDTTHAIGQLVVNGASTGNIEMNGDRDWIRVQLTAGLTYLVKVQGLHSGFGTLIDPYLRLQDGNGQLLASNDDVIDGVIRESQLAIKAATSGNYYVEVGAFNDQYTGTYKVSLSQAAAIAVPGRTPEPTFDSAYYRAQYPDVAAAGIDPQLHYDSFGWKEGRNPNLFFDTGYYLASNPDVARTGIDPFMHFEVFGWKEGRNPGSTFSVSSYLQHNPDVALAGLNPLDHYLLFGVAEHRSL